MHFQVDFYITQQYVSLVGFIGKNLSKEFIQNLKSLTHAINFYVKIKNKFLRMCIDFCRLKN